MKIIDEYKVCSNQIQLIESALRLALELKTKPQVEYDWKNREYVKICSFTIENDEEILTEQIPSRFFEIFDNYIDIQTRAKEEMMELYNDLSIKDSGEDVYLSDGMYLSSDGSLH